MDKILNKTKTEWIIINNEDEIWVGQKNPYFLPLSEFAEARTSLKSYRGWKSAINGILQAGGCTEDDIRNNRIRVLPVTTILQVDENYEEIPVSKYFRNIEIKRYIMTEKYNLIFDLQKDTHLKLNQERFGSNVHCYVSWNEKDKYGEVQHYSDEVIKSSDDEEELKKLQSKPMEDLVNKLIEEEYAEDVKWMDDEELWKILRSISDKTGKYYELTLHDNVESWGSTYDLSLYESTENKVSHEQWLCYTR